MVTTDQPLYYQYRAPQKPKGWVTEEEDAKINVLALRYRSEDRAALGELYATLLPHIKRSIRPYIVGLRHLPVDLEVRDLYQQSCVELAELVLDWNPDRRNFAAYFFGAFPWRLHNFLRWHHPAWRTNRFEVISMGHDLMIQTVAHTPGVDGRDWDDDLACQELLGKLTVRQREVVELHVLEGISLPEIGRRLGINQSTAYDFFSRAMRRLRSILGASPVPQAA